MSEFKTTKQTLFDEFPPVSRDEWEKVISRDLKGGNYKKKLRWETGEGVAPLPFYRRDDMEQIPREQPIPKKYADDNANSWEIREPIFAHDIATANTEAQNALERGAQALQFHLNIRRTEGMLGGDLQGLPIQRQSDFSALLEDISLTQMPLHFDSKMAAPALLAMLGNEVSARDLDPQNVWATFSYDPFIYLLQNGQYPKPKEQLQVDVHQMAEYSLAELPNVRPLAIDGRVYHNAGATIVQELGYALSEASEYFSILTESGLDVDDVAGTMHFSFSVGSNYFLEIAKFRAARLLWKNLLEAYGGDSKIGAYLHGETSRWNKTLYDPYSNMLRTSTEGMSAAIAGCDSMTILPFDEHFRQPDQFSQRIARNQQIIFSEEAYLDKVEDPAAGSYYIEKLTDDLGQAAWELFQDIETQGGLLEALEGGTIQSAIQDSQQNRNQAIAERGRIFVGTNQYSNADETVHDKIDSKFRTVSLDESENGEKITIENLPQDLANAFANGATLGDVIPHLLDIGKHKFRTVTPYRGTKPFEELRLATENHDFTPTVLTLPMGNKKWRKGRSTFSANFFGCAGYNIKDPIGFADVDEAISAIRDQDADIAVICSSDDEYKELVPAICKKVDQLDKQPIIVLAGYPKEDIETYKKAGVDEFIYSGCNVLEALKRFQKKLSIIEN